jgi:hypothetical protein
VTVCVDVYNCYTKSFGEIFGPQTGPDEDELWDFYVMMSHKGGTSISYRYRAIKRFALFDLLKVYIPIPISCTVFKYRNKIGKIVVKAVPYSVTQMSKIFSRHTLTKKIM